MSPRNVACSVDVPLRRPNRARRSGSKRLPSGSRRDAVVVGSDVMTEGAPEKEGSRSPSRCPRRSASGRSTRTTTRSGGRPRRPGRPSTALLGPTDRPAADSAQRRGGEVLRQPAGEVVGAASPGCGASRRSGPAQTPGRSRACCRAPRTRSDGGRPQRALMVSHGAVAATREQCPQAVVEQAGDHLVRRSPA